MLTRTHLLHVSAAMSARSARSVLLNALYVLLVRRMKTVTHRLLATCALLEASLLPVLRLALRVRLVWLTWTPILPLHVMLALALATTLLRALRPVPCARPTGRTMTLTYEPPLIPHASAAGTREEVAVDATFHANSEWRCHSLKKTFFSRRSTEAISIPDE